MSLHSRAAAASCAVPWAACFRLTASSRHSVSQGWVDFFIFTARLGMLSSAICNNCSVSRCAPSEGKVSDMNFQLASSMLLCIRTQSASLKCHTSRSGVTVSGILNLTCVKTALWSATAAQGFAVQSGTSVRTKSKMSFRK